MIMRRRASVLTACLFAVTVVACNKGGDKEQKGTPAVPPADTKPPKPAGPPPDPKAPADVKAAPADAEKTASGLASKVLSPGTGTEKPGPSDTVKVHYT